MAEDAKRARINVLQDQSMSCDNCVTNEEERPFLEPSTHEISRNVKTPNYMEEFNKTVPGKCTLHPSFKEKKEKGEEEEGYFACDVKFSPIRDNLIAVAYSTPITCVDSSVPGSSLLSRGGVCVWDTHHPSQPHQMLLCEATPTCCCFSPQNAYLAFASNVDGSIVLWDLREPEFMHKSPLAGFPSLVPRVATFTTACLSTPVNHGSPNCTIAPLTMGTRDPSHTAPTSAMVDSELSATIPVAEDEDYNEDEEEIKTREEEMEEQEEEEEKGGRRREERGKETVENEQVQGQKENDKDEKRGGIKKEKVEEKPLSDTKPSVSGNSLNISNCTKTLISLCTYLCLTNEDKKKGFPHRATLLRCRQQYHFPVHTKELGTAPWIFILLCLFCPGMTMMFPTGEIIASENQTHVIVNCSGDANGIPQFKMNGLDPNNHTGVDVLWVSATFCSITVWAAPSINNTNVTCAIYDSNGKLLEIDTLKIYIQAAEHTPKPTSATSNGTNSTSCDTNSTSCDTNSTSCDTNGTSCDTNDTSYVTNSTSYNTINASNGATNTSNSTPLLPIAPLFALLCLVLLICI